MNTLRLLDRMQRATRLAGALALAGCLSLACDDDTSDPEREHEKEHERDGDHSHGSDAGQKDNAVTADAGSKPETPAKKPVYALSTFISGGDGESSTTYVTLFDTPEPKSVDLKNAQEFTGTADMWAFDDALFVSESESLTITKFEAVDGQLEERGKLNFTRYGITDFGFWRNVFISPTKAYFLNESQEVVVWNPKTMLITSDFSVEEMAAPKGLMPMASYVDRSSQISGDRLYVPVYFSDDSYFKYGPDSKIAVFDTKEDKLIDVLTAPCPGLDYSTRDEDGNMFFSSWVFAPGGAALLDQPKTCVIKIGAKDATEVSVAFKVAEVTEGREGGVFRYTGKGKGMLAVLHPENAGGNTDVEEVAYGANWRFWSYDLASGAATQIDDIDWNSGAAYVAEVDDKPYMLVPTEGYGATVIYDLTGGEPRKVFDTKGWVMRFVRLQ